MDQMIMRNAALIVTKHPTPFFFAVQSIFSYFQYIVLVSQPMVINLVSKLKPTVHYLLPSSKLEADKVSKS